MHLEQCKGNPSTAKHFLPHTGTNPQPRVLTYPAFLDYSSEHPNANITLSQNHRMLEGTSGVTQSNPLTKQGHLEQTAQDLVQAGLYLQRRTLSSSTGIESIRRESAFRSQRKISGLPSSSWLNPKKPHGNRGFQLLIWFRLKSYLP